MQTSTMRVDIASQNSHLSVGCIDF